MSLGHLHLTGAAFRRPPLADKAPNTFTNQSQNAGNAGFTKTFTTKRREAHLEGTELVLSGDFKGRNFVTVPIQFTRGNRAPATVHASKRALFFLEAGNPKRQPGTPFRPLFASKVLGKSRKPTADTVMSITIRCYPVDAKNVLQHDDDETAAGNVCTFQIPYGKLKGVFMPPDALELPTSIEFCEDAIELDMSDFRPRHMFYADLISLDELIPDLEKYGIEAGTMAFIGNRNVVRFHHDGGVMVDFHKDANILDAIRIAAAEESILPPDVNHGKTVKRSKGKGGKSTTVVTQRCGYSVHRRVDGKPTYDTHADFPAALEAARAGWPSPDEIATKRAAAQAKRTAAKEAHEQSAKAKRGATKPRVDPETGFTTVPKRQRKGGKANAAPTPVKAPPAANKFSALAASGDSSTESEDEVAQTTPPPVELDPVELEPVELESPTKADAPQGNAATIASLLASLSDPVQIQAILASLQVSPEPAQASPEPEQASPEPEQASSEPEQASSEPEQASPEPAQASPEPMQGFPTMAAAAKLGSPSRGVSKPMPSRKATRGKPVRMSIQDFAALNARPASDPKTETESESESESESDESGSDLTSGDEDQDALSKTTVSWAARAATAAHSIAPGTAPKSPEQASADRAKDKQSRESKTGRKAKAARNKKHEEEKAAKVKATRVAKEQRSGKKSDHRSSSDDAERTISVASSSPQPSKPLSPGKAARKERREAAKGKATRTAEQTDAEMANQAKREVAHQRKVAKTGGKAKPKHEKVRR